MGVGVACGAELLMRLEWAETTVRGGFAADLLRPFAETGTAAS